MTFQIKAWADGSCWNKTGQGGWCAIIAVMREGVTEQEIADLVELASLALSDTRTDITVTDDDERLHLKVSIMRGYEEGTTNNRMEMRAIMEVIRAMKRPCAVHIVSDSKVAIAVFNNGNARSNKGMVDTWKRESSKFKVTFEHIHGHTGHPIHDWCDRLASYKKGVTLET